MEQTHGGTGSFVLLEYNCGPHWAQNIEKYVKDKSVPHMTWLVQTHDPYFTENVWWLCKNDYANYRSILQLLARYFLFYKASVTR